MNNTIGGRLEALYAWVPYSLIALLARVIVGLVFHRSWLTKVDLNAWSIKPATFFLFANEYKLPVIPPELAAYMATAAEGIFPLLLWAGFMTRLSATALLLMTLTIQIFVYPGNYLEHGLWAIGLLTVMRFGPGMISLDAILGRVFSKP